MPKNKKILQVCGLDAGGIETLVVNIYRRIEKQNFVFDFINHTNADIKQYYEDEVTRYGATIYKTGAWEKRGVMRIFIRIRNLYHVLKINHYDVIHIHATDNISMIDAFTGKIAGIPRIVIHSHNSGTNTSGKKVSLKNLIHCCLRPFWKLMATDYLACSKKAADWMFPKGLVKKNQVKYVKNGIELNNFKFCETKRQITRQELGIEQQLLVGHTGRFSEQKNHKFLIKIFSEIKKKEKDAKLLLVGTGELEECIKELCDFYKIKKDVIFYGVTEKVNELMMAMDLFILPSKFEGLPLVGIEAQAAGLYVAISDSVTKEMNVTGNIDYLSLKRSEKEWAQHILNRYKNFKRSENTYKKVMKSGFGIDETVSRFVEVYS